MFAHCLEMLQRRLACFSVVTIITITTSSLWLLYNHSWTRNKIWSLPDEATMWWYRCKCTECSHKIGDFIINVIFNYFMSPIELAKFLSSVKSFLGTCKHRVLCRCTLIALPPLLTCSINECFLNPCMRLIESTYKSNILQCSILIKNYGASTLEMIAKNVVGVWSQVCY